MKIEFKIAGNGEAQLKLTPEDDFEKAMLKKVFVEESTVFELPPNMNDVVIISNTKK